MAGLAAAALLGTGLAGTAQAAYPGADGRIAFVRGGNLYTITQAGTGLRRLTSGGRHSGPRWSPDGRRIAYVYRGNLWIMAASGARKTQVTAAAPRYADSRPSWSPSGRYLAFVRTRRGRGYGYLTRYDTVTGKFATFSTPYRSEQPTRRQTKVTARPAPVAWGWALSADGVTYGSFILVEGTRNGLCHAHYYCLDAIGWPHQYQFRNGFPSAEDQTKVPTRLTDPDWFPITPLFGVNVLTSQEHCSGGNCSHSGIDLGIGSPAVVPGAYQAVYSPIGRQIAYVRKVRGTADIYLAANVASPEGHRLAAGTQPDWQPRPASSAG